MPPKSSMVLIGLMICLNTFYGCGGLKKEPVGKKYFDLNINNTSLHVLSQNNIHHGPALMVKEFAINPVFDSHYLVYRVGKNEYVNDYYNEFISYPARLITEKIEESLCASSHFTCVPTNMKQDIAYRLSGKITRLYGDFQDTNDPKAIIEIRLILEKKTDNAFKVISGKTYLSEEGISSREPAQLVLGWNTGLLKIMTQFINDYQSLKI